MKRITVNFIVDLASFLVLLGLSVSGIILMLPHGGQGFRGGRGPEEASKILGLDRHECGEVHQWLGIAFVVLMLVHLVLHWGWITCYIRSLFNRPEKPPCEEKTTS